MTSPFSLTIASPFSNSSSADADTDAFSSYRYPAPSGISHHPSSVSSPEAETGDDSASGPSPSSLTSATVDLAFIRGQASTKRLRPESVLEYERYAKVCNCRFVTHITRWHHNFELLHSFLQLGPTSSGQINEIRASSPNP